MIIHIKTDSKKTLNTLASVINRLTLDIHDTEQYKYFLCMEDFLECLFLLMWSVSNTNVYYWPKTNCKRILEFESWNLEKKKIYNEKFTIYQHKFKYQDCYYLRNN